MAKTKDELIKELTENAKRLKEKLQSDGKIVKEHSFKLDVEQPDWEKLTEPLNMSMQDMTTRLVRKLDKLDDLLIAFKAIKIDIPKVDIPKSVRINNLSDIKSLSKIEISNPEDFPNAKQELKEIQALLKEIKSLKNDLPTTAKDAIAVRLSDGENFYKALEYAFSQGGGGSTPKVQSTSTPSIHAVPVVNPDGTDVNQPSATGGLSTFRSLDLDESEEQVSSSPCTVHAVWITNKASTTRWVKLYNATAANTTVGTTTPQITMGIPGNSTDNIAANLTANGYGISFTTALSVAATTGLADNDTGAPSANDVVINLFYK